MNVNYNAIQISLVIDDYNTVKFKLEMNQTDGESINALCEQIAERFSLSDKAKSKLYKYITKEIEGIKSKRENKKSNININPRIKNCKVTKNLSDEIFNRLYYQGTENKKKKEESNEKIKKSIIENEMKNYSFTPKINKNSKIISQRNYTMSIGDKLYSQRKKFFVYNKSLMNFLNSKSPNSKGDEYKYIYNTDTTNYISKKKGNNNKSENTFNKSEDKEKKEFNLNKENINLIKEKNNTHIHNASENIDNYRSINNITYSPNNSSNEQSEVNVFNRLHNSKIKSDIHKEKIKNIYFKDKYPFEPKISKGTFKLTKYRNESPMEFFNRLAKQKNFNNITTPIHLTKENKISKDFKRVVSLEKRTKMSGDKKTIKEIKNEEILQKNIEQYNNDKNVPKKLFKEKILDNYEKFKSVCIKEIFELLTKDKTQIDFEVLRMNNIPKHIINKIVKPTCYIINDKNLEFNFQNFNVIFSELLVKYLV